MPLNGTQPVRSVDIVAARPAHASSIDQLLRELAIFEGTIDELTYKLSDLTEALAAGHLSAIVGLTEETVVGCLTFTWDYALWSGGKLMRIDDLFVRQSYRGKGVGTALMHAAARLAIAENATIRWEVEVTNANAQRFYRKLGAHLKSKIIARWFPAELKSLEADATPHEIENMRGNPGTGEWR